MKDIHIYNIYAVEFTIQTTMYTYLLPTTNLEVGSGICVYACKNVRTTVNDNGQRNSLNLEICFGSPRLQTWRWCAQSGLRCLIC